MRFGLDREWLRRMARIAKWKRMHFDIKHCFPWFCAENCDLSLCRIRRFSHYFWTPCLRVGTICLAMWSAAQLRPAEIRTARVNCSASILFNPKVSGPHCVSSVVGEMGSNLQQLLFPRVFIINEGGFETFATEGAVNGARLGDIKPSALSRTAGWSEIFAGRYSSSSSLDNDQVFST
jgi:hypothetical protein